MSAKACTRIYLRYPVAMQFDWQTRRLAMLRQVTLSAGMVAGLAVPAYGAKPAQAAKQKLYVTNSGGDDVHVIDVATNKVIGRIEVGPHPHGLTSPAAQDVIYVTIEGKRPGELVCIDTTTDKILRRMDV